MPEKHKGKKRAKAARENNGAKRRAALPPDTVVDTKPWIRGKTILLAASECGYHAPLYRTVRALFDSRAFDEDGTPKPHPALASIARKLRSEFKDRAVIKKSGAPAAPTARPTNPIWSSFLKQCRSDSDADKVKK